MSFENFNTTLMRWSVYPPLTVPDAACAKGATPRAQRGEFWFLMIASAFVMPVVAPYAARARSATI
jgi:hypothetical protein